MKKILISLGLVISTSLPVLVLAAAFKADYVTSVIDGGLVIVRDLLIFLISLAVVWFIWNVIKYSMSAEEDGKEKAKTQMIHGIIAIAVIVSVWGLVAILRGAFGTDQNAGSPTDLGNMIPGGNTITPAQQVRIDSMNPINDTNTSIQFGPNQ